MFRETIIKSILTENAFEFKIEHNHTESLRLSSPKLKTLIIFTINGF